MRKYREYTVKDIKDAAKEVISLAQLLKKLNLKPCGGNYIHFKKKLQELKIDCSHWKGQGWSKDQQLKDWTGYTRIVNAKKHLIEKRGHFCEICKLSEWLNKKISLEIHHIDEDRTNNNEYNLQLLCPNCHSQTKNFRNPKWERDFITN